MALTAQQLATLKADITADGVLNAFPNNGDGNFEIAKAYNAPASPAFTAWKTSVTITEVGDKINGGELAGLSSLNNTRLQTVVILSQGGVNPSMADRRQFFDDIFSGAGGATTRASLLALWKTLATRVQKLFAAGTGSDASPATLAANVGQSFQLTAQEVETARNLP
jgi:hypothetical protein